MIKAPKFSIPFDEIKQAVLPENYELSLVFTDKKHSRNLNKIYRGKDKSTNVLSFPISDDMGEIFIDLETAKDEAPDFDMGFENFVGYLFIHGVLHLKGLDHGEIMDKEEKKLLKKFFPDKV